MQLPPEFRSDELPLELGTPLRTPNYSWGNWGIHPETQDQINQLLIESEYAYQEEWFFTNNTDHKAIANAARKANLEDANAQLNTAVARIVARIVKVSARIIDIGAGAGTTTAATISKLSIPSLSDTVFTLIDPSYQSLHTAIEILTKKFKLISATPTIHTLIGKDTELAQLVPLESQDLAIGVASLHHHADITPALKSVYSILRPGGWFIIGDWHNSMWEHPRRVFKLLSTIPWRNKEIDLLRFVQTYPKALEQINSALSPEETVANQQICDFWRAYAADTLPNQKARLQILEGHRPIEKYVEDLGKTGFKLVTPTEIDISRNPLPLLQGSNLLCVTIARKNNSN